MDIETHRAAKQLLAASMAKLREEGGEDKLQEIPHVIAFGLELEIEKENHRRSEHLPKTQTQTLNIF